MALAPNIEAVGIQDIASRPAISFHEGVRPLWVDEAPTIKAVDGLRIRMGTGAYATGNRDPSPGCQDSNAT